MKPTTLVVIAGLAVPGCHSRPPSAPASAAAAASAPAVAPAPPAASATPSPSVSSAVTRAGESYDRLFVTGHSWRFAAVQLEQYGAEPRDTSTYPVDCEIANAVTMERARVSELRCSTRGSLPRFAGFFVRTDRGLWHLDAMPTTDEVGALRVEDVLVPAGLPLASRASKSACEPDDEPCGSGAISFQLCVSRSRPYGDGELGVRWCFAEGDLVSAEEWEGDDGIRRVTYRRR